MIVKYWEFGVDSWVLLRYDVIVQFLPLILEALSHFRRETQAIWPTLNEKRRILQDNKKQEKIKPKGKEEENRTGENTCDRAATFSSIDWCIKVLLNLAVTMLNDCIGI